MNMYAFIIGILVIQVVQTFVIAFILKKLLPNFHVATRYFIAFFVNLVVLAILLLPAHT